MGESDGTEDEETMSGQDRRRQHDDDDQAAADLAHGRVARRLLQPDPGESKDAFKARLLAAALGLDAAETDRGRRPSHDGTDEGHGPTSDEEG